MALRVADLVHLKGKTIKLQVDQPNSTSGNTFSEVTGKVLVSGPQGLVVQNRSGSTFYEMHRILDVEEVIKPKPDKVTVRIIRNTEDELKPKAITKRWVTEATMITARQHLADRHGYPVDLLNALPAGGPLVLHSLINHGNLGHTHEDKPKRRTTVVTSDPTPPIEDEPTPTTEVCDSCGVGVLNPNDLLHEVNGSDPTIYHCDACMDEVEYAYADKTVA